MMGRALVTGALIRWCSTLPVLTVLLAPRWIGAEAFGIGATIMAFPYFVQGLCEPIIVSMCISELCEPNGYGRLGRVRNELGRVVLACAAAAIGFGYWQASRNAAEGLTYGLLAAGFLMLAIVNTWLIGLGYALRAHSALMWSLAAAGTTQLCLFWWLQKWGVHAMLASLILSQTAHFAVSCSSPTLRAGLYRLLSSPADESFRPAYLATLAMRIPTVLLSTGTVFLGGVLVPPSQVAALRMTVGLAGGLNYVFPISPQMLQATLTGTGGRSRQAARRVLATSFVALCVVSAGLAWQADAILGWLLSASLETPFDGTIFWAVPCFLMMQPVAAYLYATGQQGRLVGAMAACCAGFVGGALTGAPAWAFTAGAAAHLGWTLSSALAPAPMRRRAVALETAGEKRIGGGTSPARAAA